MSIGGKIGLGVLALAVTTTAASAPAFAQQKPNILVIMADDIGYWNISAYNRGMMGYHTPNIDRIANEGAIITASNRAPQAAQRSSPARARCGPVS
jgi:arylsulfatase